MTIPAADRVAPPAHSGPPRRVFISYSSKDDTLAKSIIACLDQAGISCWFAPHEIKWGEQWDQRVLEGLASCYAVVVLLTEAADASKQVHRELAVADGLDRPLLPLLQAGFTPRRLKLRLATSQYLVVEKRSAVSSEAADKIVARLRELADQHRDEPIPTEAEIRATVSAIAEPSDATLWRVYASKRSRLVVLTFYLLAMLLPSLAPGRIGSGLMWLAFAGGATLVVATRRLNLPALFTFGFVQPVFMVLLLALQRPLFVLEAVAGTPPWRYGVLSAAGGLIASFRFGSLKRDAFSLRAWRAWIAPDWSVLRPIERVEAVANGVVLAAAVALMALSLVYGQPE